jgi:hypothetical protein
VIQSQTVNLVGGYNVVYIRMFRNKASVLTSNDPAALPKQPVAVPQVISAPITTPIQAPIELIEPIDALPVKAPDPVAPVSNPTPGPASGNMEGLKPDEPPNLLNSFQQLFN